MIGMVFIPLILLVGLFINVCHFEDLKKKSSRNTQIRHFASQVKNSSLSLMETNANKLTQNAETISNNTVSCRGHLAYVCVDNAIGNSKFVSHNVSPKVNHITVQYMRFSPIISRIQWPDSKIRCQLNIQIIYSFSSADRGLVYQRIYSAVPSSYNEMSITLIYFTLGIAIESISENV